MGETILHLGRLFTALLPALLLLTPGTLRAEWQEAASDHFVVYADTGEANMRRLSERLERYHAALTFITSIKLETPSPSNRVTVYVVRDLATVRRLHGGDNKNIGGFYMPRAGGSLAIVPQVSSGDGLELNDSMLILLHEYAHHFLISSSSFGMPRWMGEGAAEFFASASFKSNGDVMLGRPAQHRAAELSYAPDVHVRELLDPDRYKESKRGSFDAFYGKSWLLYHYLTFDTERRGQLVAYSRALIAGKSQPDAAAEAFGDLDKLERDLGRYQARSRLTALSLKAADLPIGETRLRKLSAGETATMPLLVRQRRGVDTEEAKVIVGEARTFAARFAGDAAVQALLAEAEFDAGDSAAAIKAADAALAIDPTRVNAHVQKGYALFDLAKDSGAAAAYARARAAFVKLNRLEPNHPIPLIYFYRTIIAAGRAPTPLSIDGLVRAVQVAPFDLGLRANLATALLSIGQTSAVDRLLRPIAYDPHGGPLAERAKAALDRMARTPEPSTNELLEILSGSTLD